MHMGLPGNFPVYFAVAYSQRTGAGEVKVNCFSVIGFAGIASQQIVVQKARMLGECVIQM